MMVVGGGSTDPSLEGKGIWTLNSQTGLGSIALENLTLNI